MSKTKLPFNFSKAKNWLSKASQGLKNDKICEGSAVECGMALTAGILTTIWAISSENHLNSPQEVETAIDGVASVLGGKVKGMVLPSIIIGLTLVLTKEKNSNRIFASHLVGLLLTLPVAYKYIPENPNDTAQLTNQPKTEMVASLEENKNHLSFEQS